MVLQVKPLISLLVLSAHLLNAPARHFVADASGLECCCIVPSTPYHVLTHDACPSSIILTWLYIFLLILSGPELSSCLICNSKARLKLTYSIDRNKSSVLVCSDCVCKTEELVKLSMFPGKMFKIHVLSYLKCIWSIIELALHDFPPFFGINWKTLAAVHERWAPPAGWGWGINLQHLTVGRRQPVAEENMTDFLFSTKFWQSARGQSIKQRSKVILHGQEREQTERMARSPRILPVWIVEILVKFY